MVQVMDMSVTMGAYAGWAVTANLPVKYGTAHGRLRPEVGSTKRIDVYGSGFSALPCYQ